MSSSNTGSSQGGMKHSMTLACSTIDASGVPDGLLYPKLELLEIENNHAMAIYPVDDALVMRNSTPVCVTV